MAESPDPTTSARSRRVEPVLDDADPEEVFDPRSVARPAIAAWLLAGPLLGVIGYAGFLRLVAGVRGTADLVYSPALLATDAMLLALFVLPHSLLARGFGRRWLNRPLGPAAERPLYVLVTGVTLTLLVLGWRDCGPMLWEWDGLWSVPARAVQIAGLVLAVWAAAVVGIGQLFGLAQLRALESGRNPPHGELVALPPFSWMRHPINVGTIMMIVAMPEVSADRLLLMIVLVGWILVATPYEERDAEIEFGEGYARYKERVARWKPHVSLRDRA